MAVRKRTALRRQCLVLRFCFRPLYTNFFCGKEVPAQPLGCLRWKKTWALSLGTEPPRTLQQHHGRTFHKGAIHCDERFNPRREGEIRSTLFSARLHPSLETVPADSLCNVDNGLFPHPWPVLSARVPFVRHATRHASGIDTGIESSVFPVMNSKLIVVVCEVAARDGIANRGRKGETWKELCNEPRLGGLALFSRRVCSGVWLQWIPWLPRRFSVID